MKPPRQKISNLKIGMYLLAVVALAGSCSDEGECSDFDFFCQREAKVSLKVEPGEAVEIGTNVVVDASDSIFDEIDWRVDGDPVNSCKGQESCPFTWDEVDAGDHIVSVRTKVNGNTGGLVSTVSLGNSGSKPSTAQDTVTIEVFLPRNSAGEAIVSANTTTDTSVECTTGNAVGDKCGGGVVFATAPTRVSYTVDNSSSTNQSDASTICSNFSIDGFSGWFVPAQARLISMCGEKTSIGGFTNTNYWSSSTAGSSGWIVDFSSCSKSKTAPTNTHRLRCMREP